MALFAQLGYLLVFLAAFFVGYVFTRTGTPPVKIQPEIIFQAPAPLVLTPEEKILKDGVLFEGNSLIITETRLLDLKRLSLNRHETGSCLNGADKKIERTLSAIGLSGDIEYFRFEAPEMESAKVTVNFDIELFSKISPASLKNLDEYMGFTDFRDLYLIRNGKTSYLLLVGHQSATSGIGHLYRLHLLVPLDPNKPGITFDSISEDPRRIKIDASGTIYYVQIDDDPGNPKESRTRRLDVSLISVEKEAKVEYSFDLICKNTNMLAD